MRFHRELRRAALWLALGFAVLFVRDARAQEAAKAAQPQGIPIDDQLTISKCGGCHKRDANGMMGRLSYIRTSPEVWDQAIKRMIRLNGLTITPAEFHDILRFLSSNNGLAPEEMKPAFFEVAHETDGYQDDYTPNASLQNVCNRCHSIGRVLEQRRTREDYEKLVNMHIGLFPGAANIFRPTPQRALSEADAPAHQEETATAGVHMEYPKAIPPPTDGKYPVDLCAGLSGEGAASDHAGMDFLEGGHASPETGGHLASEGLSAWQRQNLRSGGDRDQARRTTSSLPTYSSAYASTGTTVKSSGKGIVYTGYNWRGRVTPPGADPAAHLITATAIPTGWREAMMVSRDGNSIDGRWFWGGFGELGIDVHLVRAESEPVVLGTDLAALQSPSKDTVKIYGGNLPASLKPSDIDLGNGVTVTKIVSATPSLATVEVDVAKGLPVGMHDLAIGRASVKEALAVYDKIAYIQVEPEAHMSKLGGIK